MRTLADIDAEIAVEQARVAQIGALHTRAAALTAQMAALDDSIAGANDRIRWFNEAAHILSCPNCDCRVVLREGELVPVDPSIVDLAPSAEELEQMRATLTADTERRVKLEAERSEIHAELARAVQSRARLAVLRQERTAMNGKPQGNSGEGRA